MSAVTAPRRLATRAAPRPRGRLVREQALVAGAQIAAGVGNLVFALAAAHVLAPEAFSQLVAFLALYLMVHVPASSLSATSALRPDAAPRTRRRAIALGALAGAAVAAAAWPLGPVLDVPPGVVLALAAALPLAGWLALERGRLYGQARHGRAALSLVAEPVARLALGLPLAAVAGPVGGAAGVVAGGWLALAATNPGDPGVVAADGEATAPSRRREAWIAAAAFLLLAVLQNQDVLLANARLVADEAGRFAVLSTLGGIAAFATTTVPLVLLPRARAGDRGALAAALGAAAGLGLAAVLTVALVPSDLVGAAFGDRYASIAPMAVPYLAAMGLLGVARVLVADHCARGRGGRVVAVLALVAAVQAAGILLGGRSAGDVAFVTLVSMAAAAAGAVVVRLPIARVARPVVWRRPSRTTALLMAMTALALVVRLLASRSLWLDEATSITQAQLSLGDLLDSLRASDVHPPLHHLMLWALAHTLGTGELTMRVPSIIAGTALVPVVYLLGREVYDRRAGLAAAALGTVAPFAVWYSQEARMYALFMLFAALALLGQLRALRRGAPGDWALFALASAGMLWTQYFGVLFAGVQQVGFIVALVARRRRREPIKRLALGWLAATAVVVAVCAPLVPFALDQFQANQASGRGFGAPQQAGAQVDGGHQQPGVYIALTNVVWAVWGYHSASTMAAITALWPLGMLVALLLLGRGRSPRTALVVACAVVPAIALFFVGEVKPFLFEIRYFAGAVPLLLVLLARAATAWARGPVLTGLVLAALLATFSAASADQQVNRSNPRLYDFEGTLAKLKREVRPGDVVLYDPGYLQDIVRYYAPDMRSGKLSEGVPPRRYAKRVFIMASFLEDRAHARATAATVHKVERTRDLVDEFKRPQIRVWVLR